MKKIKLNDIGEFCFLKNLEKKLRLKEKNNPLVKVGIGDDAFAAEFSKGKLLVVTNDVLVENIHFRRKWMSPQELGYKALCVNLSDLAAMGGAKPLYTFVGLALPGDIPVDCVDKLYTGMNKACSKYGSIIVGGDTVASKKDIVISITLLGEIDRRNIITRSGARPGDMIFATGTFGDSGAGLKILQKGRGKAGFLQKKLIEKHIKPVPRMKLARLLSQTGKVTSMIDSSDGLAASINIIADKSSAGADIFIEKIPVSQELQKLSLQDKQIHPIQLALNSGEDYELVFTAPKSAEKIIARISTEIKSIGVINKSGRVRYLLNNKPVKIHARGYQAFG